MVQVLKEYYQPEEEELFAAAAIRKGRVEKASRKPRIVINHMNAFDERSEDEDQDEGQDEG